MLFPWILILIIVWGKGGEEDGFVGWLIDCLSEWWTVAGRDRIWLSGHNSSQPWILHKKVAQKVLRTDVTMLSIFAILTLNWFNLDVSKGLKEIKTQKCIKTAENKEHIK